ncbi:hypothetical protein [Niveispirillum sp.]|uniref:hypothetical protein n=1 Tax=Niveispirillum sp. TaxID=1917217 RepID=UPI001B73075C|nr:hypothetical protein [Niveispirillum sp.]MBP7338834.1 hypothetical protein [Niveispirillum sp.]
MKALTRLEIYGAAGTGKTHLANRLRALGIKLKDVSRPGSDFRDAEVYTTETNPYVISRHLSAMGHTAAMGDRTVTVNLPGVHIGLDTAHNVISRPARSDAEMAKVKQLIEAKLDELDELMIQFRGGEPAGSAVIFWGDGGRDTWFRGCPACTAIQLEDLAAHLRATPVDDEPAPTPACH